MDVFDLPIADRDAVLDKAKHLVDYGYIRNKDLIEVANMITHELYADKLLVEKVPV